MLPRFTKLEEALEIWVNILLNRVVADTDNFINQKGERLNAAAKMTIESDKGIIMLKLLNG